jgi:hypothetical protein
LTNSIEAYDRTIGRQLRGQFNLLLKEKAMRIYIVMAASALCLLGCATPQDRALAQQAEVERMMIEFGPACTQLGHVPNTDPWRNCILQSATNAGRTGVSTSIFGGVGSGGRSSIGIGFGIGR